MEFTNKKALALAWSFFKGNVKLNVFAILILIAIGIISLIPIIGVVFSVLAYLITLSYQIFIAKEIAQKDKDEIDSFAKEVSLKEFLFKYFSTSIGAWLGFLIIWVILAIIAIILVGIGGMELSFNLNNIPFFAIFIVLILITIFLYVYPAVMGGVFNSNDFGEAFKKVFLFFSPSLWKKSFKSRYFGLIFFWSLILLGFFILAIIFFSTIILFPIGIAIFHYISLYDALIYNFSYRLIQEDIR